MKNHFKYCPYCGKKAARKKEGTVNRPYCDKCRRFLYDNPAVGVGVVAMRGRKVLLIKRTILPGLGMWAFPGGFVERGESVEQAAIRELFEETGVRAKNAVVRKVYTEHTPFYGTVIVPIVEVSGLAGEPEAREEVSDAAFVPVSKRPLLAFKSHNIYFRERFMKGRS